MFKHKMRKTLTFITILITFAGIIFLLYEMNINTSIQSRNNSRDSILVEILKEALRSQVETIGVRLDGSVIIEDERNDTLSLRNVIGNSPRVILHFSDLSCSACIDIELPRLKQLREALGEDKVLILTSYDSRRTFEVFRQVSGINSGVYNLRGLKIGLSTEESKIPSLFLVDSSLIVRSLFVPLKEFPELSDVFYQAIRKRFLEAH